MRKTSILINNNLQFNVNPRVTRSKKSLVQNITIKINLRLYNSDFTKYFAF